GVGKSHLAQALGHQACIMGYKTIYCNTARLFKKFKLCKVDGTYLKELGKLLKADLLILDDFGLQAFDNHAREALMDIIDDRYNTRSALLYSLVPVSGWEEIIVRAGSFAEGVWDRVGRSSHIIDVRGQSMRKGSLKVGYQ